MSANTELREAYSSGDFNNPPGRFSYCFNCQVVKPERAHHCSTCNKCYLRMDHHCPWVGNCIGAHNQKYFCMFLFWALMLSAIMLGTLLQSIIALFNPDRKFDLVSDDIGLLSQTLTCGLGIALLFTLGFLIASFGMLCMQLYLIRLNITTLECNLAIGVSLLRFSNRAMPIDTLDFWPT